MNDDKQAAMAACDSARTKQLVLAASAYIDAYMAAEGKPEAPALRVEAGERFQAGLTVLKAAHDSSLALVEQVFP